MHFLVKRIHGCHRLGASIRHYATATSRSASNTGTGPSQGAATFQIFDRNLKRTQRDRAADNAEESRKVDYLRDEVANRLAERLLFINRTFPEVLDLGAGALHLAKAITRPQTQEEKEAPAINNTPLSGRIHHLTCAELSSKLLNRDDIDYSAGHDHLNITKLHVDEEELLLKSPDQGGMFEDGHFDAVISSGSMHWINDLPTVLRSINRVLKPDGLFLAAMFGGDSLFELRTSMQLADMERLGGVSPHVSPLADVKDVGGLLQRGGFKLLTIDVDDIIVEFPDVFALMKDLGRMGESNAVWGRQKGINGLKRDALAAIEGIYRELHGGDEKGEGKWDGGIPATFRVIYMIGWKESPNQQKSLPRGSGEISIKDVLAKPKE